MPILQWMQCQPVSVKLLHLLPKAILQRWLLWHSSQSPQFPGLRWPPEVWAPSLWSPMLTITKVMTPLHLLAGQHGASKAWPPYFRGSTEASFALHHRSTSPSAQSCFPYPSPLWTVRPLPQSPINLWISKSFSREPDLIKVVMMFPFESQNWNSERLTTPSRHIAKWPSDLTPQWHLAFNYGL